MDFDRLRAFVWTLEEGGVSAAAKRLCRTQPAVTRMLQTLEEQVGAELIDRHTRPMRPTNAGLRVLDYAREILQAADRMADGTLRPESTRQILRMGVSRSLLWQLRDPRFIDPDPRRGTDFIVRSGWSPRLYRRFTRGEFDGAILLMPVGWPLDVPCRSQLLRCEPLVIVGPRAARAPGQAVATLEALSQRPWILNPDGCGFRHSLARGLAAIGHRLHVQFEMDAAPVEHLSMVAAGLGCSIVPASAFAQDLKLTEQVQQLTIDGFDHELGVWLIWNERCVPNERTHDMLTAVFSSPSSTLTPATSQNHIRG